ncbi:DUF4189 domain-containing protein [Xanthomonas sp. GPE 39]|uniref:DUF4189 domain-containing protein n=1 Tax=Xanthomonas sp. GPE 39 TaxID=1583099 RepID=UPI0009E49776|nr:DUF4189 domain-containing protein [Xanthomonas sp. GPE 39]
MKYTAFFSIAIFIFSMNASAEGNCPPGQYPIGGQGAVGCAPIPQDNPEPQQPRPTGKWIKTWGAIAIDASGNLGVSTGKLKKTEADQDAMYKCESAEQGKCRVVMDYNNQCIAVANPNRAGDIIQSFSRGPSIEVASHDAISDCQKKNSGIECKILYESCSEQIFQKF